MKMRIEKDRFHRRKAVVFLTALTLGILASAPALAKAELGLEVKAEKEIVKTVDGKEVAERIPVEFVDVGDVIVYGVGQLSMRIWLDVEQLSAPLSAAYQAQGDTVVCLVGEDPASAGGASQ